MSDHARTDPPAIPTPLAQVADELTELLGWLVDVHHLSLHDPLTGVANRVLLHDRLKSALARTRRAGGWVAVLYIDLDGFKTVNDRHGHAAGDRVLQHVARSLEGAVRPEDTVARLGGDEFAVVIDRVDDADGAMALTQRVHAAIARPLVVDGTDLSVTASIGMTVGAGNDDAEQLLADADAAMYAAKAAGSGIAEITPAAASRGMRRGLPTCG